jgi:hypothetical protein
MADNVAITAGSGTTIGTDEVAVNGGSTVHVQYVKLVDGTANGTDGIPGTTSGLGVVPRRNQLNIQVTSAGLTNATYAAGDQLGNQYTFASAARVSGGTGRITSVVLMDEADTIGPVDVVFFDRSVTLAADNAAFSISDADLLFVQGYVQLAGAYDFANNRLCVAHNLSIPYTCNATSLYAACITRSANAAIASATAHKLQITVERD